MRKSFNFGLVTLGSSQLATASSCKCVSGQVTITVARNKSHYFSYLLILAGLQYNFGTY